MLSKQTIDLIKKRIAELKSKIANQIELRDAAVEKAKREASILKALKSFLQALEGDLQE